MPERNEASNTTKFIKSLLDHKSTKNEWSHFKTVGNIKTKSFDTFSAAKFREPIEPFIDNSVDRHEIKISQCEKELDAKTALKLELESWHLLIVTLYSFNGHASHWP